MTDPLLYLKCCLFCLVDDINSNKIIMFFVYLKYIASKQIPLMSLMALNTIL